MRIVYGFLLHLCDCGGGGKGIVVVFKGFLLGWW